MGHWESNPKREIHSITGLSKKNKKRKSSNNQSNFTLKGTWKEQQTNPKMRSRKKVIKIRAEISEIESKKNDRKDQ